MLSALSARKFFVLTILFLAAFLLAACAGSGARQPTPTITLLPEAPEPLPPKAASDAEINLSQELDIPREEITIVEWQAAEWPDGCLGLGGPGELCTQVITPGWRVVLEARGQRYIARTDQLGEVVRFESGPRNPS